MDIFGNQLGYDDNTQRFRVIKSMMVESGTYNQAYTRPYVTNMSTDVVNLYANETEGGRNVNRGTLAGIANNIMSPASVVDAQVNVANGWNERRIIFMIEIMETTTNLTTVIMGYADKVDLSLTGIIDPELRMTFNSTLTLRQMQITTPHGPVIRKSVVDNAHLLGVQTNNSLQSLSPSYNQEVGRVYTQRPTDVANNLSLGFMNAGIVADGRTQILPNQQIRSKRANNSAPTYLSEVINGITQTAAAPEMQEDHVSQQIMFNEAGAAMRENSVYGDPVLRTIVKNSNMNNLGFVTWGVMCNIFPDLDHQTRFYTRSSQNFQLNNHFESTAGSTEHWDVVRWESILATTVFNTLPSLISQCMLMGVSGTMTNDTVDSMSDVSIEDARAFVDGFDRTQAVQQIEYRLLTEVMPGLTMNNQRSVFVAFNINLVRDGWVSISIDGQPAIEYSSPCFADGLLLPTVSTNENSLSTLASNINTLIVETQY